MTDDTNGQYDDETYDEDTYDDDEAYDDADEDAYDEDDEDDEDEEDEDEGASPKHHSNLKWGLLAVAILAVVAVVLVAVEVFGGSPEKASPADNSTTSDTPGAAGIASAHDTGPVAVITDDPSCAGWTQISSNLATFERALSERDRTIPSSAWDEKQRGQFQAAAQLMRLAAGKTVGLVTKTPNRVMRELYEQFIAYARAYAERIPGHYTPSDDNLAGTADSAANTLSHICASITDGSAVVRGPLVPPVPAPAQTAPPGNIKSPQPYLTSSNPVCGQWTATLQKFAADTADWAQIDPKVPAMFWNPQQRSINLATGPVMMTYANKLQQLGQQSGNPALQDFADLSAQYRRAFAAALPSYEPTDQSLAEVANYASTLVLGACAVVTKV